MEEEKKDKKSKIVLIIVLILLLFLIGAGIIYYLVFYNRNESSNQANNNENNRVSLAEDKEKINEIDLSQYDGKILKITSVDGKIKGSAYLTYEADVEKLKMEYQAFLNDDLSVNGTCGGSVDGKTACDDMIRYEYAQKTISQNNPDINYGVFLYPVLCNKDRYSEKDKFKDFTSFYGAEACGIDDQIGEKTSTFLVRGQIEYDSYEEILGTYDVVVYDSSQYWIETTETEMSEERKAKGERRFELESDKSILPKNEVNNYVMEIQE